MNWDRVLVGWLFTKKIEIILEIKVTCRRHRLTPQKPVLRKVWPIPETIDDPCRQHEFLLDILV